MLKRMRTTKELDALETEKTGAADWLSMWATILVPLTAIALGLFVLDHSTYMRDIKHAQYVRDSAEAAKERHYKDSMAAWEVRFYDSLGKARIAEGWCDIDHMKCSDR